MVEALARIRVVADHPHRRHLARTREQAGDRGAAGDQLRVGGVERRGLGALPPTVRVDDGADAHGAVVERDVPAPTLAVRRGEDVVAMGLRHARGAGEVAPERQVLEERVELAEALTPSEDGVLPARVDDVGGLDAAPDRPRRAP
jgi:hypothetical protein